MKNYVRIPKEVCLAAKIAKDINNKLRAFLGQEKSNVDVDARALFTVLFQHGMQYPLDPKASWERWKKHRSMAGWTYSPTYNQELKQHPNLVDNYDQLPFGEKVKDFTYWAVVNATLKACKDANKEVRHESQKGIR